jgi:hypothetical protein
MLISVADFVLFCERAPAAASAEITVDLVST